MSLPTRQLGNSDLALSVLGLGTVKIGRNQGVKYPSGFELPDDRQVDELIDLAWKGRTEELAARLRSKAGQVVSV